MPTFSAMFLGGSSYESAPALAVTPGNNLGLSMAEIYITGTTESEDFPIHSLPLHPSYNATYNGDYKDIFVAHLSIPLLTFNSGEEFSFVASTFLGGSSGEDFSDIAVSSAGTVFVTGETWSSDFPVTSGAYDEAGNGIFISRLDANLSVLEASTRLGSSGAVREKPAIAVTSSNRVVVTGTTDSSGFPVTSNAYDKTYNGGYDIFISSLNADLTTLEYSSYFGGKADDELQDMLLTPDNEVIFGGRTRSADFPVSIGAYDVDNSEGDSLFLSKLSLDWGSRSGKFPWNMFLPAVVSSK